MSSDESNTPLFTPKRLRSESKLLGTNPTEIRIEKPKRTRPVPLVPPMLPSYSATSTISSGLEAMSTSSECLASSSSAVSISASNSCTSTTLSEESMLSEELMLSASQIVELLPEESRQRFVEGSTSVSGYSPLFVKRKPNGKHYLPGFRLATHDQEKCFLCKETLISPKKLVFTSCGHRFHLVCVFGNDLYIKKNQCPYCGEKITKIAQNIKSEVSFDIQNI